MNKVVIVIPIHKADPTKNELASLLQCYKVLGNHPIRIVAPEGLDVSTYTGLVSDAQFVFITPHWLSSVEQYNKLKINLYFYNLFKDYEYLLTYELDAWVFRDELLYWCDKGYDYIGAPWFEGYSDPNEESRIIGVGNSGFSLRNISTCHTILKRMKEINKITARFKLLLPKRISNSFELVSFLKWKFKLKIRGSCRQIVINEINGVKDDGFWGQHVPLHFKGFYIPPVSESIRFSFEVQPLDLYKMNDYKLPFGCHAWSRYDPKFWQAFIKI